MNISETLNVGFLTAHISLQAAGVWEVIQNLCLSLSRSQAIQPSVWGLKDDDTGNIVKALKHKCQAYDVAGPKSIGYAPGMLRGINASDLDLLHSHGSWMYPSLAGYLWGQQKKKPVIISPHGMLDPWALKNSRWKKQLAGLLFENRHLRAAHCIHALCEEEAIGIRNFSSNSPVCIIPNGVNIPENKEARAVKWIEEITKGRKTLLFLGRVHPKKGLDLFLSAIAKLKRSKHPQFNEWSTLIVGLNNNQYGQHLKHYCSDNGLQDHIHFIGPRYGIEKQDIYRTSNAFILPSLSEGMPVSVLEAWSYGLPCIITPECHLQCGYDRGAALRISRTVDSIATQLGLLFEMGDEQRGEIGTKGLHMVKDQFSWDQVSKQMLSVYQWALGGGAIPPCVQMS